MDDLFYREQRIFDSAKEYLATLQDGDICDAEEFKKLVTEYGRVLKQLRRVTRISDKTAINLNISNLALLDKVHYDSLTGIYNRRFLDENLRRIMRSAARKGEAVTAMMIDVDFFKKFNDTYGHGAGDECLKTVAKVLHDSLHRPNDFVARYGGEEFAVILPSTDEYGARRLAQRILENVRDCNIPHEKNPPVGYVTVSIGVTSGTVALRQSGCDFIKLADRALYMSKQDGRNRSTFLKFREGEDI